MQNLLGDVGGLVPWMCMPSYLHCPRWWTLCLSLCSALRLLDATVDIVVGLARRCGDALMYMHVTAARSLSACSVVLRYPCAYRV